MSTTVKKPGISRTMLVIIILVVVVGAVVAVVAASMFLGPSLSVTKKNFAPYTASVSNDVNSSMTVSVTNTNGGVTLSTWSRGYLMINGTVTARGFGSSPDAITFLWTNTSGIIGFEAIFPASNFFGVSYDVNIHVYTPTSIQFKIVNIKTVNGNLQVSGIDAITLNLFDTNGDISASNTSASSLGATDTNGGVTIDLSWGLYFGSLCEVTTTNGNINLTLPAVTSFKVTPNTTNGNISASGLGIQLANHTTTTIGTGGAIVNLTTVNGSITVTGK
jgi:hypothetical protein